MKPRRGFPDNKMTLIHNHLRDKIAVFNAYGGYKCACCGEADPEFLTLDHSDGNGGDHRRSRSTTGNNWGWGGHHLYLLLKQKGFPPGFQVLCMNCNFGKTRNNGVCPHKAPSKPLEEWLAEIIALRGINSQEQLFAESESLERAGL